MGISSVDESDRWKHEKGIAYCYFCNDGSQLRDIDMKSKWEFQQQNGQR